MAVSLLPARAQTYIDALVQTGAQDRAPLVSVVLFGSAAKGSFSEDISDVDIILVVPDDESRVGRRGLSGRGC
jgi:predicted nucleotidyltransferase